MDSDFKNTVNGSKVFITEEELLIWLQNLRTVQNYSTQFEVKTSIKTQMSILHEPYLYKDEQGKIYMIQNVDGGSLMKAISVCQVWNNNKINLGYYPTPIDKIPPTMIYGISSTSSLNPIEDLTNDSNDYLNICYYGSTEDKKSGKESRYAAMLELL